jgi:GNAT superfamily N-acetyltransferase
MGGTEAAAVETLTTEDAEAAHPLSVEAGWNQTVADWRFMLHHGRGFGVRDTVGGFAGSAIALPLGPNLSWICMVLVAKVSRRRGLGTTLLARCIDDVRSAGAVAGLDATELGRPVYLPLGFRDLYPVSRWRLGPSASAGEAPSGCTIRPLAAGDLVHLVAFDAPRSAMRREPVLRYLMGQAPGFVAEADGAILGYVLGRPGRTAAQIGPIVAEDEDVALALLRHASAAIRGPVVIDAPDAHRSVEQWLARSGAVRERGFMRMAFGEPEKGLADPSRVFALAGPELG